MVSFRCKLWFHLVLENVIFIGHKLLEDDISVIFYRFSPMESLCSYKLLANRYRFIASFSFQLMEIVRVRHLVDTDLYMWARTDAFHMFSWYTQKVLFLCQMFSHVMPIDSYQHQRSSHFIFDFLKLNLCQYVFVSTFSSVDVNKYCFCFWHIYESGKMCKNMILSQ